MAQEQERARDPQDARDSLQGRAAELIGQWRDHDRVMREMASRFVPALELPHDLTLRQLQTLLVIRARPGVTGQELAAAFSVSTPTISGLVERLVGKGLLVREPDPSDRRRVLLALTDQASGLLGDLESQGEQIHDRVLARLSVSELESLVGITARIRQVAEEMLEERDVAESGLGSGEGRQELA